ncbi:hypothetical protein, partial [Escherichia coli]|uniref:hypothetical protein n=1 Tax=Escherichia coli TaxID=562 RepID=UPI0026F54519
YEARPVGLSSGKDLNPVKIDYVPRVIMLSVIFTLIALAMGFLVKFLNKEELNKNLAAKEEELNKSGLSH